MPFIPGVLKVHDDVHWYGFYFRPLCWALGGPFDVETLSFVNLFYISFPSVIPFKNSY